MPYDAFGNWYTDENTVNGGTQPKPSGSDVSMRDYSGDFGLSADQVNAKARQDPTYNPRDFVAQQLMPQAQSALDAFSKSHGGIDTSSELNDIYRAVSNEGGTTGQQAIDAALAKLTGRAANSNGPVGGPSPQGSNGSNGSAWPGFQFSDPYTKLYEDIAQRNIASLQGDNKQFQSLMNFLNKQFADLSTGNGYTPQELAILQNQALDPIEANRKATQQRILERTSARGFLPSSGLTQAEQAKADVGYDAQRAAAGRDVAINALNERRARLADALNLGQLGVSIPDARNAQALSVANNLYQLPRNALTDALAVLGTANPSSAISSYLPVLGNAFQQNQAAQQNQQALWQMFGQLFAGAFGG